MNPLLEVWLVAARDCRKNIRSVKGLVMLAIAVMGALACTFKLPKFEEVIQDTQGVDPEQLHVIKANFFAKLYGDVDTGDRLASAPLKLVILFFIAVWLAPLMVMIIGFDGISSDLQYRSVRYWTIRTRRVSYYAGKFLALWAIIALVTFVMQVLIWVVTIVRADAPPLETMTWGMRFWATSLPITGAWCGLATLSGSLFRTPMLGLLATGALFFLLFFMGYFIGRGADIAWLRFLYPNNFDGWIMSPKPERILEGVGVSVAFILGTGALGSAAFVWRDV